jgi:hypothetical protein
MDLVVEMVHMVLAHHVQFHFEMGSLQGAGEELRGTRPNPHLTTKKDREGQNFLDLLVGHHLFELVQPVAFYAEAFEH